MISPPRYCRLVWSLLFGLYASVLQADETDKERQVADSEFVGMLEFLGEFSTEEDGWIDPFELEVAERGTDGKYEVTDSSARTKPHKDEKLSDKSVAKRQGTEQ